jgi:hypothetical protein
MKTTAMALALIASIATGMLVQATPGLTGEKVDARTRSELIAARDVIWHAWFSGDSAAIARVTPDAVAAGAPWGWEDRTAIIASARQSAASGRRLVGIDFDSTTILLRGNAAVLQARFRYVLEEANGKRSTTRGIATEVFVRQNGKWLNPFWYLE